MACSICDPIGVRGQGCAFCRKDSTNASTATFTSPTSSSRTDTQDGAASVVIKLQTESGTSSPIDPYKDILGDLCLLLVGRGDEVDLTPMLDIARIAIESELADRMMDTEDLLAGND